MRAIRYPLNLFKQGLKSACSTWLKVWSVGMKMDSTRLCAFEVGWMRGRCRCSLLGNGFVWRSFFFFLVVSDRDQKELSACFVCVGGGGFGVLIRGKKKELKKWKRTMRKWVLWSNACERCKQSGEKEENGNELQGPICNWTIFVSKL